jgi:hypothetical protein
MNGNTKDRKKQEGGFYTMEKLFFVFLACLLAGLLFYIHRLRLEMRRLSRFKQFLYQAASLLDLLMIGYDLLDRCYELRSYSVFVAKVREGKESGMTLDDAIIAAMRYCITHDLMADYFKENESEVIDMVSTKWDWNEAFRVAREDAAEMAANEAHEEGREEGRWTTLVELVQEGILTLKDAAKRAGMSEDKFRKLAAL